LAVADHVTDPLPEPLAGVQVNQLVALLAAVQLQPVPAVTVTVPLPAAEAGLALVGEIEYVHEVDPACVTVNDFPAMVRVPVRWLVLVLAVTDQVTVPLPLLLAGVQVSQLVALLEAVQLQPEPAVTVTEPLLAVTAGLTLFWEIEYVQPPAEEVALTV